MVYSNACCSFLSTLKYMETKVGVDISLDPSSDEGFHHDAAGCTERGIVSLEVLD